MRLSTSPSFLLVSDKFKGTLSAQDSCTAIERGLRTSISNLKVVSMALADGGEGSSKLLASQNGALPVELTVTGPEGKPVVAVYYRLEHSAYIDISAASGFCLVGEHTPHSARISSTYGTGQLMLHAIEHGTKNIYLFLGGSASTDGGVGLAKALGVHFFDHKGIPMINSDTREASIGERLSEIASIDRVGGDVPADVHIHVYSDVSNPLYGESGAAFVFGPQKGADTATAEYLDSGLRNLAEIVSSKIKSDRSAEPGMGAAGGTAFAVVTLLGGVNHSAPPFFLDALNFDEKLKAADIVVFGEGCFDSQSLEGKIFHEIYRRSKLQTKPVIALCGILDVSVEQLASYSLLTVFGLGHKAALSEAEECLELLAKQVGALILK